MSKFTKICPVCGKTFETNRPFQKYCSHDCQANNKYQEKECAYCGKKYSHTTRLSKYCSVECRRKAAKEKLIQSTTMRICAYCGKEFKPASNFMKYCSVECQKKANDAKKHEESKSPFAKPKESFLDKWIDEANACGMSYGQYKAQIQIFGKTFEELKAAYDRRTGSG